MGKASAALPVVGAVAGGFAGSAGGPAGIAAGAAAGASLGGAAAGSITSIQANNDAQDAQKKALQEELRQSRQVANLEDDQLKKSIDLADAQAVERLTEQTRQASEAAGQDLAQVERNLDTSGSTRRSGRPRSAARCSPRWASSRPRWRAATS
ncbi:MAG: hypothetical protein RJA36_3595 [Pseudomonadota bacterium]